MEMIVDLAIGAAALLAAAYCILLSRRLRAFTSLDGDVGQAIALLSAQVDQLTRALAAAEEGSATRVESLRTQVTAAENAARRLELLMAADRPQQVQRSPSPSSAVGPRETGRDFGENFEPFEPSNKPDARLRTTRARIGSRT